MWPRVALLMIAPLACAGGGDSRYGSSAAQITGFDSASTDATTTGETEGVETTDETEGTASTDTGGEATSDPSTDATTGTTGDDTNPGGLPNGADCQNDGQCHSGNCYLAPIVLPAGRCSECNSDADCVDAELGLGCTVDAELQYAVCGDGSQGSFCEGPAACAPGLFCAELIPGVAGILPNTCGQCETAADCPQGQLCAPTLDVANFTGAHVCVNQGAVGLDGFCPTDGTGNAVCQSQHCSVAMIPEYPTVKVGICGACTVDADCGGATCNPAAFDLEMPKGSFCG